MLFRRTTTRSVINSVLMSMLILLTTMAQVVPLSAQQPTTTVEDGIDVSESANDRIDDESPDRNILSTESDSVPLSVDSVVAAGSGRNPAKEVKLQFLIYEVKAVDETGGWPELGSDDISIGAATVNRYGVKQAYYALPANHFDDGTTYGFRPPLVFAEMPISVFPSPIAVNLTLFERNRNGGRHDFLAGLVNDIGKTTVTVVDADVTDATGVSASGVAMWEVVFKAIEEAILSEIRDFIASIVSELISWILRPFHDPDLVFAVAHLPLTVNGADEFSDTGTQTSNKYYVTFKGHGGEYRVTYAWRIVTPDSVVSASVDGNSEVSTSDASAAGWGTAPWTEMDYRFPPYFFTTTEYLGLDVDSSFHLIAKHSQKCLDIKGSGMGNGVPAIQFKCGDRQANQSWQLRQVGFYYQIVAEHSGKCLDVSGISLDNGAVVHQWSCLGHNATNQLWALRPVGNAYQVISANTGKCLDVKGQDGTLDRATIQQWDCYGDRQINQLWHIEEVGDFEVFLPFVANR